MCEEQSGYMWYHISPFPIYSAFLEILPNKFTYIFLSIDITIWLPMSAQESEKCFVGGNLAKTNKISILLNKKEEKHSYWRCYWQTLPNLKTPSFSLSENKG